MLIADDGRGFIFTALVNYANYNLDAVQTMYAQQHVIPGLSDGGAHVAFISDASFPTFLFSYWGRDREEGRMPIHDLVRRQTREPARFAGLHDRGILAPGMKADINIIDFPNLALERPEMVVDLPAGGPPPDAESPRLRRHRQSRPGHLPQRRSDRRTARRPGPRTMRSRIVVPRSAIDL